MTSNLKPVRIDRRSKISIQQQLYDRVRSAIAEGRLQPSERLPSTRSLAAQLGLARGTVDVAYARLAGEGYVLSRGQTGTIVSPDLRASTLPAPTIAVPAPSVTRESFDPALPFRLGLPALDLFPRTLWARLSAREARRLNGAKLCYPDPTGLPALREAITAYLAVSRGIACRPKQVVVTGGYQAALNVAARLLLTPGDLVCFEDPGYVLARRALESMSMRIAPIPVDFDGICVAHARRYYPSARLTVVTPAHQSPLGVSLSMPRRQALLGWAADCNAWILEDDYDSEFHYSGHKPPTLKSIDIDSRVLYAGSFSKTLFPGLRLGYLVLPLQLIDAAAKICGGLHRGQPAFEQSVVAAFMAEGHFARHLRQMRTRYGARRQALAAALVKQFGSEVQLSLEPGGLHVLAQFPNYDRDTELARRALKHGLKATPLSAQSVKHSAGQGLLLSFTNIPERSARNIVATLYRAIT